MNKITQNAIAQVIAQITNAESKVVKATKFISPTLIVRAVRTLYGKKIVKGNLSISLTIGKPNYREREFIALCKKAKEPFPIKNVQIKSLPSKK